MIEVKNIVTPSPEQWDAVVEGVRNPLSSWDKSDSVLMYGQSYEGWTFEEDLNGELVTVFDLKEQKIKNGETLKPTDEIEIEPEFFWLGSNDLKLMKNLADSGPDHGKFLRQLEIIMTIKAPLYWWKQWDTYKIGTTANSTSTMHTLLKEPFKEEDFSIDDEYMIANIWHENNAFTTYRHFIVDCLNEMREDWLICLEEANASNDLEVKKKCEKHAKRIWNFIVQILPEGYMQTRTVSVSYAGYKNMYRQRKNHKLGEWASLFEQTLPEIPFSQEFIVGA